MNKTYLIFRHELTQEIKKAGYLVMTLIVPVLALLAIGVFKLVFPTPAPVQEVVQTAPQSAGGAVGEPNLANFIIPGVFALLLGLSLMLGATSLINGLGEEKESRLIQVLFSSVSVRQLLVGKVLALGLAGLLQVLVWLLSLPLLLSLASAAFGGFMSRLQIPVNFVVLGVIYFVLGYLLFAVLSIGVGAISSNAKEANNLALFYTLGSFAPLWLSSLNMFFPYSPIWVALTLFPVTAPIMTMLRLGTSIVPTWQIVASIAALALSIAGGLSLSIRLFRVHMLMHGKRPTIAQLAQSLKEVRAESREAATVTRVKGPRLFFVDHLRAALSILVVLHHVAIVYGAVLPMFYYLEPPFRSPGVIDPVAYLALTVFTLFNQAWFMGAFFLLAGYFAPDSFDRKGAGAFVREKLVRLGIPALVFYFVIGPLSWLGLWLMPASLTGITNPPSWQAYSLFTGLGPLWFVVMLLVFSLGYAGWRMLTENRASSSTGESRASYLGAGLLVVALAAAGYLMRLIVPIGQSVGDFPTLAYLPQYLGFFVIGAIASRRNWFRTLPFSMGIAGLGAAAAASILLFPLAFSGQWFSLELTEALSSALGNGHWRSAVYALWDATMAVGLCLGLIVLFRRFLGGKSRFGAFLSRQSYAVYVIHIPLIVVVAYLLRGVAIAPLLKFGLASTVTVPVCFLAAYLVLKIPFVSRAL